MSRLCFWDFALFFYLIFSAIALPVLITSVDDLQTAGLKKDIKIQRLAIEICKIDSENKYCKEEQEDE